MSETRDEAIARLVDAAQKRFEGPTEVRCSDVLLILSDSSHPRAKALCAGASLSLKLLIGRKKAAGDAEHDIQIACREYAVYQLAEQLREALRSVNVSTIAPPKPASAAAPAVDLLSFMAFDQDQPAPPVAVPAAPAVVELPAEPAIVAEPAGDSPAYTDQE